MKRLFRILIFSVLSIYSCNIFASEKKFSQMLLAGGDDIRPLKIGDKVPDIVFKQMIGYPKSTAKLSDFKGKLLILDFWSVYCTVCIAEFPKMTRLQKQFDDKIQILPVGFEDDKPRSNIAEFLKRRKGTPAELKLPTAVQSKDDKVLQQLFPFTGLPHEIWINSEGILVGITNHFAVAPANINLVLAGKDLSHIKSIENMNNMKLLMPDDEFLINRRDQSVFGSAFAGYFDRIHNGWNFGEQADSSYWRFFDTRLTPYQYYAKLYEKRFKSLGRNLYPESIIVEETPGTKFFARDKREYMGDDGFLDNYEFEKFMNENTFSYELILPKSYSLDDVYEYMINDFDKFFKVESRVEKRPIKVLALVKTNSEELYKSKSGIKYMSGASKFIGKGGEDGAKWEMRGSDLADIINFLNKRNLPLTVVDKTGISNKVDLNVSMNDSNRPWPLAEAREQLKTYGLDLVETVHNMEVLVLYNKRNVEPQDSK